MIGIVLVSHGRLAVEALRSVTSVLGGPPPAMVAVEAHIDDSLDRLTERITEATRSVDEGDGTIVLSDMYGDSATNVSLALARATRLRVVSGVNLPLILKSVSARSQMALDALAAFLVKYGREHMFQAERPPSRSTGPT